MLPYHEAPDQFMFSLGTPFYPEGQMLVLFSVCWGIEISTRLRKLGRVFFMLLFYHSVKLLVAM